MLTTGSLRLGSIAGININVHFTWLIAFALISWTLAVGFFPDTYRDWPEWQYWATGAAAAILLFVSVLIHELAHSFVALAKGLPVHGITLFIFGGASQIGEESNSAKTEFLVAIVGPVSSLVLAAIFWFLIPFVAEGTPVEALLFYLALVNMLVGIFNLLPGFPLDGGRVLRSIVWGATGSMSRATNVAATVGQGFGWFLIVAGVMLALAGNTFGGIWMALIGWFLSSAAGAAKEQDRTRDLFEGTSVPTVMSQMGEAVSEDVWVDQLVDDYFLRLGRRAFPVTRNGTLTGIVTLTDVKEVPHDRWSQTRVQEIMTANPLHTVGLTDSLMSAMELISQYDLNQVLVLDDERPVGIVSRGDILRHIQVRRELRE